MSRSRRVGSPRPAKTTLSNCPGRAASAPATSATMRWGSGSKPAGSGSKRVDVIEKPGPRVWKSGVALQRLVSATYSPRPSAYVIIAA